MSERSAAADAVQGAAPENLSGGTDHVGSRQPEDTGRHKPAPTEAELKAAEQAKLKEQGLADDDDDDADDESGKPSEKDDKPKEEDTKWDGQYHDFGDEAANSVVDLLKEADVGAREANLIFEEALKHDDLTKIKWDVLEEKLGKTKARLAKSAINDYYTRVYQKNVATTQAVHQEVGGKGAWGEIAKWVHKAEAADPSRKAEFDEIRNGIDAGGKLAVYAAKELRALYDADPKNKKGLGNGKIVRGDNNGSAVRGTPLSKAEYHKLITEAHKNRASNAEIADLRARRAAGRERERGR